MHMDGRARDLATDGQGATTVVSQDAMEATVSPDRRILAITCEPLRARIGELVGAQGGTKLRAAIDAALPEDRERHTPLALLLDDIAGASLVGGFVWSRHVQDWTSAFSDDGSTREQRLARHRRTMVGICAGFRPGSSTLQNDGTAVTSGHNVVPVPPLTDPADPLGWHELPAFPRVAMRRARRMDIWRDGDDYRVEAHFRDSCTDPELEQVAVHEYSLDVSIDGATGTVAALAATPRILPFPECPTASSNVSRLVGQPLATLRLGVLELLRGVDCCTHLNDALRALADVALLLPAADRVALA